MSSHPNLTFKGSFFSISIFAVCAVHMLKVVEEGQGYVQRIVRWVENCRIFGGAFKLNATTDVTIRMTLDNIAARTWLANKI